MSERVSMSSWLISACSGDMYSSVPTMPPKPVIRVILCQTLSGRLGHAEVDDLRHGPAVVQGDQHVGRLDVAVDDPLLMRVLHRLADRHEQLQTLPWCEMV